MPSYTFRCKECGYRVEQGSYVEPSCGDCDQMMVRDYKADAPNLNLATCRKARA